MSKVEAYRCDKCKQIKSIDEIVGIHGIEDMFDALKSFPVENKKPGLCIVHLCTRCYEENVFRAANALVARKNDEQKWQNTVDELAYVLRKTLIISILRPDMKTKRKKLS